MDEFGRNLIELLPRLRRFAVSLCRSREIADDLVQTACAKALAAQSGWQPGTRFDAWMFRILRNAWIDTLRQKQREGIAADISDHEDEISFNGEVAAVAKLTLNSVESAIGSLPAEQREVLLLVCVEDFSYGDAAAMLGVPIGTVMSRLARARAKVASLSGIETKPRR
jgi:RNA polymerase sigma-70 factor (ECF subfamily)